MATIDLGKIKQVWRGTYNNSTAYAVDDLVEYTDSGITSSYICTTASTGNAPSSSGTAHGSWAYVAKGAASFTSPLTTRGDIFYRDASGDARFPKGTTGQVLTATANDFAWSDPSGGDVVKVAAGQASSAGDTAIVIDNVFTTDYDLYKVYFFWREDAWTKIQLIDASGNVQSQNGYDFVGNYTYRNRTSNATSNDQYSADSTDFFPSNYWNGHDDIPAVSEIVFVRPRDANTHPTGWGTAQAHDGTTNYIQNYSWSYVASTFGVRGLKIIAETDSFQNAAGAGECHYVIYGFKW